MGVPFGRQLVFGDIAWTLSYTSVPHQSYQQRSLHRHSKIQPQENNAAHHKNADKVMAEISDYGIAIKTLGTGNRSDEMQ